MSASVSVLLVTFPNSDEESDWSRTMGRHHTALQDILSRQDRVRKQTCGRSYAWHADVPRRLWDSLSAGAFGTVALCSFNFLQILAIFNLKTSFVCFMNCMAVWSQTFLWKTPWSMAFGANVFHQESLLQNLSEALGPQLKVGSWVGEADEALLLFFGRPGDPWKIRIWTYHILPLNYAIWIHLCHNLVSVWSVLVRWSTNFCYRSIFLHLCKNIFSRRIGGFMFHPSEPQAKTLDAQNAASLEQMGRSEVRIQEDLRFAGWNIWLKQAEGMVLKKTLAKAGEVANKNKLSGKVDVSSTTFNSSSFSKSESQATDTSPGGSQAGGEVNEPATSATRVMMFGDHLYFFFVKTWVDRWGRPWTPLVKTLVEMWIPAHD